jgi:hypothetical protein
MAPTYKDSAGTATVMRPETLRRYATEAGLAQVELPATEHEHDLFCCYRLVAELAAE